MQTVTYDVRGLEDPGKYDRLVELESPSIWWKLDGPLGGLHLLNEVRVPYFERVLGGFKAKSILDVGCGGGIFAEALAHGGARVVGIDASARSLESARSHADEQGLDIDYRYALAEEFDSDQRFDSVMAVDVLEHVEDVDRTLDACARALRPGGVLGFLTHNQTPEAFDELVWKGEYEIGLIPKGNHDFHKFLTPDDLNERLAARGLRTQAVQGIAFDLDAGRALLCASPAVSYMGHAVNA